ncbi:MAG: class I SAM-dependent RNA methyltransferase [Proteobacteria bacterium]|nr:class I SAM-dependent RNA methyltransferase [Pseudomonadota bacterium]
MSALCRHVGSCGGCTMQDMLEADYRAAKREVVVRALINAGVAAEVGEIVAVPPETRRRAVFKIVRHGDAVEVGFHGLKSHAVVDMQECRVLVPALVALVPRLREAMSAILAPGEHAEAHVTLCDNGLDVAFRASRKYQPALTRLLASLGAVRVLWNGSLVLGAAQPIVRFGKAGVSLPSEAFLQPSVEGEEILRKQVRAAVGKAKAVADLFCGVGTFALTLAEKARVHGVERDVPALEALAAAARATSGLKPVTIERRDLFKVPLAAVELAKFGAVVLDPPRAGAEAQARELARSKVPRIAYVSCDAQSFARDARILVDGGYRISTVVPVDQFLWSSHIELVAAFERP